MNSESLVSDLKIIEIGAEGGSITVLKRAGDDGKLKYSVCLRDQSLTFLQGDEADNEIRRDTAWTDNWDLAIAALGTWPWPMLHPIFVDPDYRTRVLFEVHRFRRYGEPARKEDIWRWAEVCRPRQ